MEPATVSTLFPGAAARPPKDVDPPEGTRAGRSLRTLSMLIAENRGGLSQEDCDGLGYLLELLSDGVDAARYQDLR